jgi:hypothetical protein
MFVSDLRQFSLGTSVSSTNKTDCHDVTEILLKVTLSIVNKQTILYSAFDSNKLMTSIFHTITTNDAP